MYECTLKTSTGNAVYFAIAYQKRTVGGRHYEGIQNIGKRDNDWNSKKCCTKLCVQNLLCNKEIQYSC